jgi:hypothetical protein
MKSLSCQLVPSLSESSVCHLVDALDVISTHSMSLTPDSSEATPTTSATSAITTTTSSSVVALRPNRSPASPPREERRASVPTDTEPSFNGIGPVHKVLRDLNTIRHLNVLLSDFADHVELAW